MKSTLLCDINRVWVNTLQVIFAALKHKITKMYITSQIGKESWMFRIL